MDKLTIPDDEFHLGITMAGAASAGCYTGGVIDYLFQILDSWEHAKNNQLEEYKDLQHLIPTHKVIIDAMGGTSAGGMTATMAAVYALNGNINPVTQPGEVKEWKNNLFYDSWVIMQDLDENDKRETFEKLFDLDDLADGKVKSLLNSAFIDQIAGRSFAFKKNITDQVERLPSYISKDLQLLLSHCLLRGIPLSVSFETDISKQGHKSIIPNHTTYEHYIVSQYHLNRGNATNPDQYLWLNPYNQKAADHLALATKATGAFPVGLLYREFPLNNFSDKYLMTVLKRIALGELGTDNPDPSGKIKLDFLEKDYCTVTVDGGAINNEPYREVLSLLKDKFSIAEHIKEPQFGVVMIDPFPDQAQFPSTYEAPADLLEVAPAIIGALTDQARVKRRELLEAEGPGNFRSIIFPRKWVSKVDEETKREYVTPDKNPIACGAAMAFAGLLDIGFRQHDFFLGRNNARNFFRYFFSFPYNEEKNVMHPIHRTWTKEMREAFAFTKSKSSQQYLPIIPDIQIMLEPKPRDAKQRYEYSIPNIPPYDADRLFGLRAVMTKRFLKILELVKDRKAGKKSPVPLTEAWVEQHTKKGWWQDLKSWVMRGLLNFAYKKAKEPVAEKITNAAIKMILTDLEKANTLAPPAPEKKIPDK